MNTAGLDFFDQEFFQTQVVVLCEYPISKMKWYSSINDQIINDWKNTNCVSEIEEAIARKMLDNFSADALLIPLHGENKIKHYFEKILWLIQSYCINGWKNPLKGINHLDNGIIVIHPGTNRCVAAKFLNCDSMLVLININKNQKLLTDIKEAEVITDETSLRNTLTSSDKILWRTESTEDLWISGIRQQDKYYKDFTYEFLGSDAWPHKNNLLKWSENILSALPLTVYVTPLVDVNSIDQSSKHLKHLHFKSVLQNITPVMLDYEFKIVSSFEEITDSGTFIFISHTSKFKKNIFELLYFISPSCSISRTQNLSIVIKNSFSFINTELIIPEHYVNS